MNLPDPVWFYSRLLACLIVLFVAQPPNPGSSVNDEPNPGVVVETVRKNFAADRAGLQEGDILLRWSRQDASGEITSPFTVSDIEIEQSQIGVVKVEGFRGQARRTWELGPNSWGLRVRPNLSPEQLGAYNQARDLVKAGAYTQAVERWQALGSQFDRVDPAAVRVWIGLRAAETFLDAERDKEAEQASNDALHIASSAGPGPMMHLLIKLGDTAFNGNRGNDAAKYYQQALDQGRKVKADSLTVAAILNDLGLVNRRRGNLPQAEDYYNQSLALRQKLAPGSLCVAQSFNNLATSFADRGDLSRAEEYLRRALEIRRSLIPESLDLAGNLNNLGFIYRLRGDLAGAEKLYEEALAIRKKLAPGSRDFANSLNSLGIVAQQRGNLAKAEERYRAALAIYRKLDPGSIDLANFVLNLGHLSVQRGDFDAAETYYQQALHIRQEHAPGSLDVARNLKSLGYLAELRGDFTQAQSYAEQALAITEKLAPGSLDAAMILDDLGMVAVQQNALNKAEDYERRARGIYEKLAPRSLDAATNLNNLAETVGQQGDLTKAEVFHRQALEIIEMLAPGSTDHAETLAALASIALHQRQLDVAAQLFEQALAVLERQLSQLGGTEESRAGFRAHHSSYYKEYIDLLLEQNKTELAFTVLERSRARSLLELLSEGRVDIRKGVDPGLLDRERSLRAAISAKSAQHLRLLTEEHNEAKVAEAKKAMDELLGQLLEIQGQIQAASPAYAALMQPEPLPARQVQQELLDPDTLLLEYMLGQERSYVFAITRDSVQAFKLAKREEIENAARRVYRLLSAQPSTVSQGRSLARVRKVQHEYDQAVTQLSKMVVSPVATILKKPRLLVVTDGALAYVPFSVLPKPADPQGQVQGPAPLIMDHEIVYLPSASVLAILRQQQQRDKAAKAVAILADPVFDQKDPRVATGGAGLKPAKVRELRAASSATELPDSPVTSSLLTRSVRDIDLGNFSLGLARLRFSRKEAEAIAAVNPKGLSMTALDFDASRATALSHELANYRMIHFATHGLMDSQHPELSGLVFSLVDKQGGAQEGFLQLQDIYNMDLRAELVVLSACETGLGKEVDGEGLVGLTRGFMHAGASRVVASLWNVSDVATAKLMSLFYAAMERDHMPAAAALRFAQMQMMRQKPWSTPYYWAAFQIQGEWK